MSLHVEPFSIAVPDLDIVDLHARLATTRWPDDPGNEDWEYGVNGAYLRGLTDYWLNEYDWRSVEARMNAYPQYRAVIDGVLIHFLHVQARNRETAAVPILVLHG